jgi:hypothetical protein
MSLANLLDINHPQDLLRGLNNTLTEYDQTKEDGEKAKIVRFYYLLLPTCYKQHSKAFVQAKDSQTAGCWRLSGICITPCRCIGGVISH